MGMIYNILLLRGNLIIVIRIPLTKSCFVNLKADLKLYSSFKIFLYRVVTFC